MRLKNKFLAAAVVLLFLSFFFTIILTNNRKQTAVVDVGGAEIVEISPKIGFNEIAERLAEKKLIESKLFFKIYALVSGNAHRLKPGRYVLFSDYSDSQILEILAAGPRDVLATIVPGETLKEVDDKLSRLGIIDKGSLIGFDVGVLRKKYSWLDGDSLEGYLLPDTYYFSMNGGVEMAAEKILDNFEEKALPILENDVIFDKLILASLLEKEIPDNEERRLAAGILKKRLTAKMPLQVDAAVIYAKCEGRFLKCPPLTKTDYKIDSPYNTYLYLGLPPTPIANPGFSAIEAALNDEKSDYWYYLSDPKTKKTVFSKTLDEHNKNRALYLK